MTFEARRRRLLRGSAAATAATLIALAFHVIGGGSLPNPLGVIVPLALSHPICIILAGRNLSLWRLSVSVAASQAIFHLLFLVFTGPAAPGPATALERHMLHHGGHGGPAGHGVLAGHGGHGGPVGADVLAVAGGGHAGHDHSSLPMLAAHLAAGAITVAMIYWAETLLTRIGACARLLIRALLPVIPRVPVLAAHPQLRIALCWVEPLRPCLLRSPVLSRGPPVLAF
ncbi:hypothetical protein [Brevibacterium otitidis]|uniref:Integral membrane protein n=1 Tax=Brevibacterium otitidis TaxID=53364 RepID=A0ABV5X0F5_9MICO|nr:hypothetical protein GCM10023233_06980 [Brevibacterium otitidis]